MRREPVGGGPDVDTEGLPLFVAQVRLMARRSDPETSKHAAMSLIDRLPRLQRRVLAAFTARGPMTAKVAERLEVFADLGFSTVRKRISELAARGYLRDTGRREAGATVYETTSPHCGTPQTPEAA